MTSAPAVEARHVVVRRLGSVDAATAALLLRAGIVAGVVELASLRIFTRTAIHIPALEQLHEPYEVVSNLARYAFFVSVLLLGMNLAIVVWERIGSPAPGTRVGAGMAAAFLISSAAARAGLLEGVALGAALATVVVAAAAAAAIRCRGWERTSLALLAAAHLASSAHTIAQDGARYGWRMDDGGALLVAGEAAALMAILAAGAAWAGRPTRRDGIIAAAVALAVLGALVANGSTVKILLLWSFGIAGYFPSVVYAAAAGAVTLALVGARRSCDPLVPAGLVLLLVGGLGLHSTYQSGLVLLGFLLLAAPARETGLRPITG